MPHLPVSNRFRPSWIHVLQTVCLCLLFPSQQALAQHAGGGSGTGDDTDQTVPTLSAVTVQGEAADGTTEGSGLYTSDVMGTATGLSLSVRETPQSVSVVTRQQIEDQGLRNVETILQSVPGISTSRSDSSRSGFSARGFSITNIQSDGVGTPIIGQWDFGGAASDSAIYDRVEVVRGATGLMTGSGEPSAAVNFIRKRPLKEFTASAELGAGSKNTRRGMADISTPVTKDARVRARLVASYGSNDSHVSYLDDRTRMLYGIVRADLTAATVLDVGVQYQRNQKRGFGSGFPLFYSDGSRTDFDRSVANNTPWARIETENTTLFVDVNHQFANDWKLRAAYSHNDGNYRMKHLYRGGAPDRTTGLGMSTIFRRYAGDRVNKNWNVALSGPFQWLGHQHELAMGWMRVDDHNNIGRHMPVSNPATGSFFAWRNNTIAEPEWTPTADRSYQDRRLRESGGYATGRFSLGNSVHAIVGARISHWEIAQISEGRPSSYKVRDEITPYAGVTWDLGEHYTVYASYTEIFQPQSNRAADASLLPPVTGKSYEVGLKTSWLDGLLGGAAALYKTRQDNVAEAIPGVTVTGMPGVQAYRAASGATVEGLDVQVNGQITPRWNLAAGYTHFTAKRADGAPLNPHHPRSLFKLNTHYQLVGVLEGLGIGGGVTWQSRISRSASSPLGVVNIEEGGYLLAHVMARYAFNKQIAATLHIHNLFDKTYHEQLAPQGWWGAPRNVMLALRMQY